MKKVEAEAKKLVEILAKGGLHVSFAESCTGGLAAAMITSVPGASEVFDGSAVTYANRIKEKLLGVSGVTLREYGAVSPQCAREMARGAMALTDADIGVSLTGIAGPDGGSEEKPVGTVFLGVATRAGTSVRRLSLDGCRDEIRRSAALEAIREATHAAQLFKSEDR